MRVLAAVLALWAGLAGGQPCLQDGKTDTAAAQERQDVAVGTELVFSFVPKGTDQPAWEVRLKPDRSGSYRELLADSQEQPILVSEAVWKQVARGQAAVRSGNCETKQKGIAQTGLKTFSLVAGTALTSCKFNYSDNDALNEAANEFIAVAQMMQQGAKLQRDHRFDRLALDADMDSLLSEMQAGRALEPRNIAPVLQAIADDDRVIDRVRRKAARMLQDAAPGVTGADKPR